MSRLIANRAFRYQSRELSADEEFEAESKDVIVLTRANDPLARMASAATPDAPDLLDQDKKARRYNRRDLLAKEE